MPGAVTGAAARPTNTAAAAIAFCHAAGRTFSRVFRGHLPTSRWYRACSPASPVRAGPGSLEPALR